MACQRRLVSCQPQAPRLTSEGKLTAGGTRRGGRLRSDFLGHCNAHKPPEVGTPTVVLDQRGAATNTTGARTPGNAFSSLHPHALGGHRLGRRELALEVGPHKPKPNPQPHSPALPSRSATPPQLSDAAMDALLF